jgi:xanthine/CO dehydrogenase XdhC/CoxF family maturation factor
VKEITNIVKEYNSLRKTVTRLALATVIDVEGSSYRRTGARMLIQDNGIYHGGISGGCIEGNALKKASLAIAGNKAIQVTYDTANDDEAQIGVSLGCNGVIRVLIAPVNTEDKNNAVEQLKTCIADREPNILITVLAADTDLLTKSGQVYRYTTAEDLAIFFGEGYESSIGDDILQVLASGKSAIKTYARCQLFLEFITPATRIIIMGGNYDVYPLLKVTHNLGWQRIVVANPKRLAHDIHQLANLVVTDFNEVTIDKYTVGIIMSHDYNADLKNLMKALKSKLLYIGLLGPAIRKEDMLAELDFKIDKEQKTRLFGPAGLDIGASQPEEIAISIVSEVLSVMRKRPGTSLKDRLGPIYDR